MNQLFTRLFQYAIAHRAQIIKLFYIAYVVILIVLLIFGYFYFSTSLLNRTSLPLGRKLGTLSSLLFLIIVCPGILGRFRFKHPLITIGIMFRRYLGILMYLLVVCHLSLVFLFPTLKFQDSFFPLTASVFFGFLAHDFLFFLFLTSNDFSVKKLGKWWKRLHKTIYLIFWLIFLHIYLRESSLLSILMGFGASLEIISLLYDWMLKRQPPQSLS